MAPVDDTARLDRLLQRYPGDADIAWFVERVEPRHARVRRRDAAVRAARALFPGPPTTAARMIAAALLAHYRTAWAVEQHAGVPHDADDRRRALHAILQLNGGKPLAYRRIMDIFK